MNLILNIFEKAITARTGMNSLTTAELDFEVATNTASLLCSGMKDGKEEKYSGSLAEDKDAEDMRKLFLTIGAKVEGELQFLKISLDFVKATSEAEAYYLNENKEKKIKTFTV